LYLGIVLFWPDNGFLQPKYFAKILKYCQFADVVILDGIKILLQHNGMAPIKIPTTLFYLEK
jgi:hypothetical protein